MSSVRWNERDVTLLDLLDRALDKGMVLWGDVTLSVAEVDLVYVGLKVLLSSVETAERMRRHAIQEDGGKWKGEGGKGKRGEGKKGIRE